MATMQVVDRLFAPTVAAKMGVAMINIPQGAQEWPITSSSVAGAWAATETGNVAGPTQFTTAERTLSPGSTYGVQLRVTRKALLQSGAGLEQAIRRDLSNAIAVGLDRAIFLGAGSSGEPAGLLVGSYGITSTAIGATASWSAFRAAIMRFLSGNAAAGPSDVRVLIRPEIWSILDATLITSTATSEWDRMLNNVPAGNIALTSNALAAPTGSPLATTGVLMTSAGGLPPAFCGLWSSIDLIRDVYTDAQSGGVRLTGLLTADVTASRASQIEILTGLRIA